MRLLEKSVISYVKSDFSDQPAHSQSIGTVLWYPWYTMQAYRKKRNITTDQLVLVARTAFVNFLDLRLFKTGLVCANSKGPD